MGILGVLLAAAAGFGSGAAWYTWHGERWLRAAGRSKADLAAERSPLPFVIAAAASLLTAIMMRHILVSAGVTGALEALVAGLGIGAFMAAPWIVLNYALAGRPHDLWWIDGLHVVIAEGLIGLVLGIFV